MKLLSSHFCRWSQLRYKSTTNSNWKGVIGLEVHAQIATESKLFSPASTSFSSSVNESVSFFDAAIPGTLPVLNRKCVEQVVLVSQALKCQINPVSRFDRKHYFYADLPAGYQITQQLLPIASNGELQFYVYTPGKHKEPYCTSSRIKQIQLEQDSGKSLHDVTGGRSLIDLNRAGVPLMELVFEPDLKDGEEAAALVNELLLVFERLEVCSCKMEEGALRVDANISIMQEDILGTRTEVKNIGSIRGVANAVDFEIKRQINILENGGSIQNETRSWDAVMKKTVPMRDKEEKQDYRFMPEPNLTPIYLNIDGHQNNDDALDVRDLLKSIPVLPQQDRQELMEKYNLSKLYTFNLVNIRKLLLYFKDIMKKNGSRNCKKVVEFLIIDLLRVLHEKEIDIEYCQLQAEDLGIVVDLLENQTISKLIALKLLEEKLAGNKSAIEDLVKQNNWEQINDINQLEEICRDTMSKHEDLVQHYRKGKGKAKDFNALVKSVDNEFFVKLNMKLFAAKLRELLDDNKKN